MKYKQLSLEERESIRVGLELGKSMRVIARELGRSHTTVSREVCRNRMMYGPDQGRYVACKAHGKAVKRMKDQRTKAPLKCPEVFLYVREHLRKYWSPETIAGRLSIDMPGYSIHHETIYRYVYSKPVKNRYKLWKYLPLKRPKRMSKGGRAVKRPSRLGAPIIDLRPDEANQRLRVGDWETDNMNGIKTDKEALSVTVDRKLRYTELSKTGLRSIDKSQAVIDSLSDFPEQLRHTITFDNGPENAGWEMLEEQLNLKAYACHAYHSWEKGTVENTIGRIRRFFPKGSSLQHITHKHVAWVQHQLNHTPRKCLNWKTPHEALMEELNR